MCDWVWYWVLHLGLWVRYWMSNQDINRCGRALLGNRKNLSYIRYNSIAISNSISNIFKKQFKAIVIAFGSIPRQLNNHGPLKFRFLPLDIAFGGNYLVEHYNQCIYKL